MNLDQKTKTDKSLIFMKWESSPSHLESGHVGGLQSLLKSLAEQVVTDRGPRRHWRDVVGRVHLHMREEKQETQIDTVVNGLIL